MINETMNIQDLFSLNKPIYSSHSAEIDFVQLEEDLPTNAKGNISWRSVASRTNQGEAVRVLIKQKWSYGLVTFDEVLITKVRKPDKKTYLTLEDKYLGHIGEILASTFKQGNFKQRVNALYNDKVKLHNDTIMQARKEQHRAEQEEQMATEQLSKMIEKMHEMEMELKIKNTEIDKLSEDVKDAQYRQQQAEYREEQTKYALMETKLTIQKMTEERDEERKQLHKAAIGMIKKVGEGYSPMKAIIEFSKFFKLNK